MTSPVSSTVSSSVVQAPAAGTSAGAAARSPWRRFGWVFAAVWLVFLLNALLPALRNPDRVAGGVAVAALVAFGGVYVWSLTLRDGRRDAFGWAMTQTPAHAWGTLALLTGLAALAFPGAGTAASSTFVFLAVYALFALQRRTAVVLVLALVLACTALGLLVPGWDDLGDTALSTGLAGTTIFGITATARRSRQLAEAQKDLARLAVVEERGRVARDLHDLLGHSLTVVTLKAQLAARLVDVDPARAAAEMGEVERLSRDALADVRAALAGYREASLGTELAGARQALAAAGIDAHLPTTVDERLPPELREVFAWAVREGVTNVVRHSGATRCWVEVSPSELVVSDDGRGPGAGPVEHDGDGGGGGSGLTGLAHRATAAGAVLSTGPSSAGGFRLAVAAGTVGSAP